MKKKNVTTDDLAMMVQNEFRDQRKYMDGRFDRLEKRMDKFEKELKSIKIDLEELKLKFNNVAYRFELNQLIKRVEILERKIKSA